MGPAPRDRALRNPENENGMKTEAKKEWLAYCGIYCGDCLGQTGVIADAATTFVGVLEKVQFHRTVASVFPDKLEDYKKLRETLGFMTGLRCPKVCRERKDADVSCEVRKCCTDKGFYACYECDDFETCDTLRSQFDGLHALSCVKNLKAIKEMGLEAWIKKGKHHRYWDEVDQSP